nr:F-box protein At3g07870-like [Quercus suber]POE84727.1 f-box protein [Quercus suber]
MWCCFLVDRCFEFFLKIPPKFALGPRQPRAFLNGALHRVAFRAINVNKAHHFVLVFDLGDEVFREILLPEELPPYTHDGFLSAYVSIYGNSIALFHDDYISLRLNIWVMKHYGVASSWTKTLSLPMIYQGGFASTNYTPKAVGFTWNGRIVLEMDGGHLMSQDLKTQEIKDLKLIGYNYNFVDAYVESLVLLDKAANGAIAY